MKRVFRNLNDMGGLIMPSRLQITNNFINQGEQLCN